jgi:hypothetical protein
VAFNDVDFCLRLGKNGFRNVWTPHAELYHRESASRGSDDTPEKAARFQREVDYMLATWGQELKHDPFYNDNFSTEIQDLFQLAFPPRRQRPWLRPHAPSAPASSSNPSEQRTNKKSDVI